MGGVLVVQQRIRAWGLISCRPFELRGEYLVLVEVIVDKLAGDYGRLVVVRVINPLVFHQARI